MVLHSDPLAALEIYCKFPESSDPTFDDAYIFGEIVRLLMKHEKYDDPRLGPNMISLGRVLGIGLYGINNKLLGPNMISLGRVLGIGLYGINNKLLGPNIISLGRVLGIGLHGIK